MQSDSGCFHWTLNSGFVVQKRTPEFYETAYCESLREAIQGPSCKPIILKDFYLDVCGCRATLRRKSCGFSTIATS